jgi:hypothetical protein
VSDAKTRCRTKYLNGKCSKADLTPDLASAIWKVDVEKKKGRVLISLVAKCNSGAALVNRKTCRTDPKFTSNGAARFKWILKPVAGKPGVYVIKSKKNSKKCKAVVLGVAATRCTLRDVKLYTGRKSKPQQEGSINQHWRLEAVSGPEPKPKPKPKPSQSQSQSQSQAQAQAQAQAHPQAHPQVQVQAHPQAQAQVHPQVQVHHHHHHL